MSPRTPILACLHCAYGTSYFSHALIIFTTLSLSFTFVLGQFMYWIMRELWSPILACCTARICHLSFFPNYFSFIFVLGQRGIGFSKGYL